MTPILTLKNVSKSFGNLQAVDNVSFQVEKGEIFGIAGPNGAGKTTLFNIISSLPYSADGGQVLLEDREIQALQPHIICHLGLARTFQKETVFETLTVLENIFVAAAFSRQKSSKDERHLASIDYLEFVGLTKNMEREAIHLSLLEKKLLMLASALVTKPKVLLLDEPASGLTESEIRQLDDLLMEINRQGVTIIVIEHVLPLLLGISQRLMILNEGKKLIEGQPEEVTKDVRVIHAYLGDA